MKTDSLVLSLPSKVRILFLGAFPVVALVSITVGCATTGDPYEDTVLWSKKKANRRLEATEEQIAKEQNEAATAESVGNGYSRKVEDLQHERATLDVQLNEEERRLQQLQILLQSRGREIGNLRMELANLRAQVSQLSGSKVALETLDRRRTEIGTNMSAVHRRIQILVGEARRENPTLDLR